MVKNNVLAQGHAHLNNPMRNSQYLTSIVQYSTTSTMDELVNNNSQTIDNKESN